MSESGKKKLKKKCFAAGISRHNLITFGLQGREDGMLDDSEDSDYEPMNDDQPSTSKRKRKRGKRLLKSQRATKKTKKSENSEQIKNTSTNLDWSHRIPNELLLKIFMYAVYNFTAVPLLCRVMQVCQKWNVVASDPCLWYKIDLSYMANFLKAKDEILTLLRGRNLLKYVQEFDFSGWQKLTSSGLEVVAEQCKDLTSLNLSRCKRVTARGISLVSNCENLTSVNLSYIETDATSNMSIKNLVQERGSQLKALCLAGNKSVGTPSLVAVQSGCGNLKVLDLSSTSINNLHVERLQAGCPKLVELRLSQLSLLPSTVRGNQMVASAGFPDLELLSLASTTGGDGTNDMLLQRLLKTSSKLRQLDLRGCEKITHRAFLNLAIVSLEQLLLSRCKLFWKDLFKIIKARWRDSLKELDVSWGHDLNDAALLNLASPTHIPNTVLTVLNLAGSGVTAIGVRSIVDSCPNLCELNLTSCRGVPRGEKQFHDSESIKKLRAQLQISPESVELHTLQ